MSPSSARPKLWHELGTILLRRERPSARLARRFPEGERHSAANGPITSILVPMVVISMLGDIPLSLVAVSLSHTPHPLGVHLAIALLSLLTLAWAIAVRSVIRALPHVVSQDALWLGGALGVAGSLSRAAIRGAHAIPDSPHAWMRAQGLRGGDVVRAHGLDAPNLAVELHEPVTTLHGRGSGGARRWVLLYADQPSRLAARLQPAAA